MKLYNYIYKRSLLDKKSLIIIIDLGEFNNVDIHIDCQSTIFEFIKLMDSLIYYRDVEKINTKFIDDKITKFLEEIYHNEIDPYSRGEN